MVTAATAAERSVNLGRGLGKAVPSNMHRDSRCDWGIRWSSATKLDFCWRIGGFLHEPEAFGPGKPIFLHQLPNGLRDVWI
jgi:hypothetical protein